MKIIKGGYDAFPNQPMGYPQTRWESFQNYGRQGIQRVKNNGKNIAIGFVVFLFIIGCIIGIYFLVRKKPTYECNQKTYQCEKFEKKEGIEKEKGDFEDEDSCKKDCVNKDVEVKYKCNRNTYTCNEDPNGEYETELNCEDACVEPKPTECNSDNDYCKYINDPFKNNCLIDYVRNDDDLSTINKTNATCKEENEKNYIQTTLGDKNYCQFQTNTPTESQGITSLYDCLNSLHEDTENLRYFIKCDEADSCPEDLNNIQLCKYVIPGGTSENYYYYNNDDVPTDDTKLIELKNCNEVNNKYNDKEYNSMKDLLEDINNDNIVDKLYQCNNDACNELSHTDYLTTTETIYNTDNCNDECVNKPTTTQETVKVMCVREDTANNTEAKCKVRAGIGICNNANITCINNTMSDVNIDLPVDWEINPDGGPDYNINQYINNNPLIASRACEQNEPCNKCTVADGIEGTLTEGLGKCSDVATASAT